MWLHLPGARVDLDGHTVHHSDGREPLTRLEGTALRYLASRRGEACPREELEREVWGYQAGVRSEAVPVAMRRLRAKLGKEALLFVRGEGWRLAEAALPDAGPAAPAERDGFVGREAGLVALVARFAAGARLVTLIGTVGTGKSRLALRFAALSAPGRVVVCGLTDARSVDAACTAMAAALGVGTSPGDPVEQLGRILGARGRVVVVLDDAEGIAPFALRVIGAWLDRAPEARFLVTSRAVLGLRGEALFAVEPLSVPLPDARTAAEVLSSEAGKLLAVRAGEVSPGFVLSDADAPAAALLLVRLEGIPLAIELAVARLRVMGLPALAERTKDRFRLLVAAGRADRQATLQAAIGASWDLLAPWEAAALGQLSVFQGTFDLAAAEAVIDLSAWPAAPWTPDVVQSLVDRSLLRRHPSGRLGMYAAIAEFAANRREAADRAEARHGAWYAEMAGRDRPPEADLENLVAAHRRAARRGDADIAAACAIGASQVLAVRGPLRFALELADAALALPSVPPARHRSALRARGGPCSAWGARRRPSPPLTRRIAASREAGDAHGEARGLGMRATLLREVGRPREAEAEGLLAVAFARKLGDVGLLAAHLQELGSSRGAGAALAFTTTGDAISIGRLAADG